MRKSPCCATPAAIHGARRRICLRCHHTWTIRPRRKGRKSKRVRVNLAASVMLGNTSLRGLSAHKSINRETIRKRFHKSLKLWLKRQVRPPLPEEGSLIAVVDALWFKLGKHKQAYGCFVVLLRPVDSQYGHVTLMTLLKGRESKYNWQKVFAKLPRRVIKRIVAITADGFTALMSIAEENDWYFQWCHVHMKRRVAELRGVRKLPGKIIRQRVNKLIHRFLETPDNNEAEACLKELRQLFSLKECPHSLIYRLSGIIKRSRFFRTYREAPEYNLPISTNSVEQVNNQIRRRMNVMRGLKSVKSLKYWLATIHKTMKPIRCNGYKETIGNSHRNHTKRVS